MKKLYAATDKYDGMGVKFYFHADSQKDADSKIAGWNRYHGHCDSPGWGWHEAVEAESAPNESWIHNEYIR